MTIAYSPTLDCPPALIANNESGASEAASMLIEQLDNFVKHYSAPRLEFLASEIMSFVQTSEEDVRDPEMAPISNNTARAALRFALLLPRSLPLPELAPDPDGEVSFDWIGKAGKMFSVSVDETGRLAYAGRFGEKSKIHGIEQLSQSCPQEILRGIERAMG